MVMWPKLKGACAVTWRDRILEAQILWSISDSMFEADSLFTAQITGCWLFYINIYIY